MRIVKPAAKLLAYTQLVPHDDMEAVGYGEKYTGKVVERDPCSDMSRVVERCGRVSWKSEAKIERGSADDFMTRVVNIRKDESIAEHCSATILFVMDRYASHQLVRHRIGAYTQESTHYINYAKKGEDLEFIAPMGVQKYREFGDGFPQDQREEPAYCLDPQFTDDYLDWYFTCLKAEQAYLRIVGRGKAKHHAARFVLPGCLKTEIAVTYNLRIWRYVFGLRCTPNNTPETVQSMKQGLQIMHGLCPPMFDDQYKQFLGGVK